MGFQLLIGGNEFQAADFSVQEAATPLAAGDSSGQVGTTSFSIADPDPEVLPNHPINLFGPSYLIGKGVRLADSRKGFTLGSVTTVQRSRESTLIQVTATSRLGDLSVFNVQAQPYSGSLQGAFAAYMALAGITSGFSVDPAIATRIVSLPGWSGELWFHLKQMTAALDCELSLVSGIILLRPLRTREAIRGRDIQRQFSVGGGSLAQAVEVYQYNNRPISNELVYPPGGWSEDVTIINVNAGETVEQVLELSASVSSITQPVMQTFVSRGHDASSVFTVVGDDGLPITPAQWTASGGSLRVDINPDTVSLTVHVTAPVGLPNKDGSEIGVYGISLSSDASTGRYSTLRIVGSGVAFSRESVRVPTGASAAETATDIGVTIDNPFLSSRSEVYTAGLRAVRSFNGSGLSIRGTVSAVNRLGETGELTLRPYSEMQDFHAGRTYAQVQTLYSGQTYLAIQENFNTGLSEDFDNQVFGNVSGARVWDSGSQRWYRIREATLTPGNIQFSADDDLLHSDSQSHLSGSTYSDVQMRYTGFSYREVDLMGLR